MQSRHIPFTGEREPPAKAIAHNIQAPPIVEPQHDVLVEVLLEYTSVRQQRSTLDWVASFGVHVAILAVLTILPLYFTAGLDFAKHNLTFLAPPVMPAAPPLAPLAHSVAPRPAHMAPARVFTPEQLTAPSFIPKTVVPPDSAGAPPDEALMGESAGIPGGQVGGAFGGVPGGVPKGVPPAPPVAEGPKVPVRVGGNVKPPHLLFGPEPEYPVLAKQGRLSGVVVIDAIIDEHGNVRGMRVISGEPLLVPAALSAVSKRKYEPTVLDGEPTPIDLRVAVSFSFS
jgi:outer membrane biosynthesis protein TonB